MARRNIIKSGFPALVLGLLVAGAAQAGPPPGAPHFIPVMTRLMKVLGDQERDLQRAVAQGRRAGIEALLTDEFEEQTGGERVTSVPQAEWIEAALKQPEPLASDALQVVSAREFGDFTALSFLSVGKAGGRFVVDLWKNVGNDQWKLAARYSGAPAAMAAAAHPKPTGKQ
jgi:hypothetical protein